MPDESKIRQRIELEGEKEYNAALAEARRNLRTLRSELKAETAELGANATAQQKNEVKVRNLRKQIEEQERIVKTYREALAEVREKYGDNADAVARWEQRLNEARASLANMRNQIQLTGQSFREIDTGARQSSVEVAAMAVSFEKISEAAGNMSDIIGNAFKSTLDQVTGLIGNIWGQLMDIAARSDNYFDLASFLGASATDVQKWDRSMKAVGGDISTVTTLLAQLKYGGKADKVTEWFGVSGENYTDDLAYMQQVLQQMVEMKDEMVANGTWATAMEEIFGSRRVQAVDGILSDWDAILRAMGEFDVDNGGVGLGEEELKTMSQLYEEVGLLQEKWNAFKESVVTKIFGGIALNLTSNFQGALDALIAFMDADSEEEKLAAMEDFKENLVAAFTAIGEAIGAAGEAMDEAGSALQQSENGYVRLMGDIMTAIAGVFEWLSDEGNLETAKHVLEGFFGLWLAGKGAQFFARMKSLSGFFTNIFSNRTLPSLNGSPTGTGTPTTGVGPQAITTQSVTNQSVVTGNTTTEHVTTMHVGTMIGGGNNLGPSNPGAPSNLGNDGMNGYNPIFYPTNLTGGGGDMNLTGGGDMNLTGGGDINLNGNNTLNLPEGSGTPGGDNAIRLGPDEFKIDGLPGENGSPGSDFTPKFDFWNSFGWLLPLVAVIAAVEVPAEIQNFDEQNWAKAQENLEATATMIEALTGDTANAAWIRRAASASGFVRNEDGSFQRDVTGRFMRRNLSDDMYDMLMGLQDRQNQQKAELANLLLGTNTAGYDTWTLLNKFWEGAELDPFVVEELMENIMNLMADSLEGKISDATQMKYKYGLSGMGTTPNSVPADWWKNLLTSDDISFFRSLPEQMTAAVSSGVSGIQVVLDGATVGYMVAPYVSQQIARSIY